MSDTVQPYLPGMEPDVKDKPAQDSRTVCGRFTREELGEYISKLNPEALLLDPGREFDGGIIGTACINGVHVLAYGYLETIESMIGSGNFEDYESAAEWIDVNTLRTLPYYGKNAPVIVDTGEEEDVLVVIDPIGENYPVTVTPIPELERKEQI